MGLVVVIFYQTLYFAVTDKLDSETHKAARMGLAC